MFSNHLQLLMYVFRMGIVCTLLSDTLVNGFTTGAAIHVLTSQVKDLLGLRIARHEGPFNIVFVSIISTILNYCMCIYACIYICKHLTNSGEA
jgi:solute carrier family 26 protein